MPCFTTPPGAHPVPTGFAGDLPVIFYECFSRHGLDLDQASAAPALLNSVGPCDRRLIFASLIMVKNYSAVERLRDGSTIQIRALQPDDRDDMLAAVGRSSTQSLRRRFFVPKRGFSEKEITFFMDIDFSNHVALVAETDEDEQSVIVGGGRYIIGQPGRAELAFTVVDAYQGKGIGTMLMRHLLAIAREAGLKELTAEVLPENAAMLKVFSRFGFRAGSGSDPQVRHLTLQLA
jgi:RimJ/RimL family protein N-acetyltransferase